MCSLLCDGAVDQLSQAFLYHIPLCCETTGKPAFHVIEDSGVDFICHRSIRKMLTLFFHKERTGLVQEGEEIDGVLIESVKHCVLTLVPIGLDYGFPRNSIYGTVGVEHNADGAALDHFEKLVRCVIRFE